MASDSFFIPSLLSLPFDAGIIVDVDVILMWLCPGLTHTSCSIARKLSVVVLTGDICLATESIPMATVLTEGFAPLTAKVAPQSSHS